MPWLLFAFGMLATIARPSAAVPGAPTAAARVALARVLRYLRGNQDLGLTYTKQDEFRLDAWVDASHGREVHQTANGLCKSRSGGFIKASGASVCALSASQATTAELYALVLLVRILLAMRRLTTFVIGRSLATSVVYCDNMSVLLQLRKRDLTSRSRHIRVHIGFVVDAVESGEIRLEHVRSAVNPANTLTAAEDVARFVRSIDAMSGRPPEGDYDGPPKSN